MNTTPHTALMLLIAQVVFVVILAQVAQFDDSLGAVVETFVVGLWLVYLVNKGPALVSKINSKVVSL